MQRIVSPICPALLLVTQSRERTGAAHRMRNRLTHCKETFFQFFPAQIKRFQLLGGKGFRARNPHRAVPAYPFRNRGRQP